MYQQWCCNVTPHLGKKILRPSDSSCWGTLKVKIGEKVFQDRIYTISIDLEVTGADHLRGV